MIEDAISRLGAVDVLSNNAGTITMRATVDLEEDDWDMNMGTNAKGVFLCMRAVSDMDVAAFVAKTP